MPDHRWRLVKDGPWSHHYVCSCGWQSRVSENGKGGAGVDLCRHEALIAEERKSHGGAEMGQA